MKIAWRWFGISALAISAVGFGALARSEVAQSRPVTSIEGTYRLVFRKLPDGRTQSAPDVMGMLTFTKTQRNFNVIWKDKDGKLFSYSLVSSYKLTETEYTESILFSVMNDQIGGKEIKYELSAPSKTVPVTLEKGRLTIPLPFDPVEAVFEGNRMTGTNKDFTDTWEKIVE